MALVLGAGLLAGRADAQQAVLLDFWLPTCGPCRQMDPIVDRLKAEGFPVRRVDGSRERDLAQRFGVDRYPTFVLVSGGREVRRVVGKLGYTQMRQLLASAGAAPSVASRSAAVVPATFGEPSRGEAAFQVGGDLGPAPEITIPGQPPAAAAGTRPAAPTLARPAGGQPAAGGPPVERLLSVSVRLRVEDPQGNSFGTGTIIDARQGEALVLTCAHLFRDAAPGDAGTSAGSIVAELFRPTPAGVVAAERAAGQVISMDLERDVALVSIRPRGQVAVARVASSAADAAQGAAVWSVGCDRGADPSVRTGRVTTTDKFTSPPSLTVTGAPVVGRSGGGLFNARGEVVGVCFGSRQEDNEGFYAKLSSIHAQLDRLGLTEIYRGPAGGAAPAMLAGAAVQPRPPVGTLASTQPSRPPAGGGLVGAPAGDGLVPIAPATATPPVFRGQTTPQSMPQPSPLGGLSAQERAAIEELARRAAESEVVCVIRPKQPGGRSEVITLDTVSPAFLRALQAMRANPPTR
ncbi:MAG: trypsin-like peptidase domain-containing protein [Planctomycetota bacterium]